MEQINELVNHEVSIQLLKLFPNKIISITDVSVSRDFSFAKIWVSILEDREKTLEACQNKSAAITKELAKKLEFRRHPKLLFLLDESEIYAHNIDKLINEIHKGKK